MQWNRLEGLSARDMENRLADLAESPDADLFLTRGNWPKEGWSYLGWKPRQEWTGDPPVRRDSVKEFAFRDTSPVLGFLAYSAGYQGQGTLVAAPTFGLPAMVLRKYRTLLRWHRESGVVEGWGDTDVRSALDAAPPPP